MATGTFESITFNRRRFTVDAEASINYALGGYLNEVKPNADRTGRIIKTAKLGRFNSAPVVLEDERGDEEFIQEAMDQNGFFDFSATKVDGTVYAGQMQIVEDPETDTKEGTKELSFMGSLAKQI